MGAAYLYAASNPETACMEIKSQFSDVISLATFELTEPMKIIDFAADKLFQRAVCSRFPGIFDDGVRGNIQRTDRYNTDFRRYARGTVWCSGVHGTFVLHAFENIQPE